MYKRGFIIILYCGIFASALSYCTHGTPQVKFIPRVAWVVDRRNSSLASELDSDADDPDGLEGNKAVVSRLLSCERPLVLRDKQLPSPQVARERFKSKVMPYINEDMVAKVVLAILYIISKDETIGTEHKESFRRYLGMYKEDLLRQAVFDVPDFLTRVLLYTTCVDNRKGQPYVEEITDTFIEMVANASWTAGWTELNWDAATQTVKIVRSEEDIFFDEIDSLNELRYSLMETPVNHTDTEWLGVDGRVLFPSRYKCTGIKNTETQRRFSDKLMQYVKLVHELTEYLATSQQSVSWSMLPDEKIRDIRRRLTDLRDELVTLGIFSERMDFEQPPEGSPLKSE